ncbi:hypothetical protein HYC85_005074 [Camellia sinensis]|uniref:RRM domain-containing protein n=1 Tax=Camellia sinensis TaxID=4442 RepID=A0A7J7HYW8_CAMSI|nr:hypothetical protein HYC85_005074 [Camellia sinensis]
MASLKKVAFPQIGFDKLALEVLSEVYGCLHRKEILIKYFSREVLGESKGTGPSSRETWWWREEVQAVVKAKKECFKKWQKDRTEENLKSYRLANKEVKKVVREIKLKVYDDLYTRLDSKEGEKRVYKLAKIRERKTRDFNQVKCIKSEDSKVLVKDDEIKERWKNYFEKLRLKEKKEAVEPEADPERDQRTVFAYQMPLKATERDVYEFFSKAGKIHALYIEFYDAMSVPMAIALSGHLLFGQPVMVKPSEAEKNLVQTNASGGGSVVGSYGAVDRKLYVGNLHFNMTEFQLKQIFEAFGPVELVQLPTDPETGHCKGFGFIQFAQLEHAKAAQSLNGKLEIAGRIIKVSSVTDHVGVQDSGAKAADFDDDDGGGLSLNAQSRALLMQKLDRSGTATSVAGSLGVPVLNGATSNQQAITLPINGQSAVLAPALPALVTSLASEPIGKPSECLLLKNMFDPATETEPDFDLDITEDVQEECSNYGRVKHIYVDK